MSAPVRPSASAGGPRLRYGSVCSGIEAATVAWHPLGWRPQFFSEIEAAPRAILKHHWPEVPLHGDFTTIREGEYGAIDLLVGGTPCQSFSVAGLRGGLADGCGNLALEYLRLAQRLGPRWLVWENVPGVLSSNGGRDFGAILGGMVELGYGFAYRVLDAQYARVDGYGRAVPQRRRRVFVVGHLGDWRRAAAVLFERASLRGDPAPRRGAGEIAAASLTGSLGRRGGQPDGGDTEGHLIAEATCGTLGGVSPGGGWRLGSDEAAGGQIVAQTLRARDGAKGVDSDCTDTLLAVAHSLRGEGFDASEDGTGRGTPIIPAAGHLVAAQVTSSLDASFGRLQGASGQDLNHGHSHLVAFGGNDTRGPIEVSTALSAHGGPAGRLDFESETFIAFDTTQITSRENRANPQPGNPCHPLSAGAHPPAVAFDCKAGGDTGFSIGEIAGALRGEGHGGGHAAVHTGWAVRRLTPTECERLQGFPDGHTAVPWRGGILPDGPRYKALGNSMAVNCMRWIGRRIEMVEAMGADEVAA